MDKLIIEKWITFTLVDGKWDIAIWPPGTKPVNAKLYRISVQVPDELIGEAQATIKPA